MLKWVHSHESDSLHKEIVDGAFYAVFQPIYVLNGESNAGLEVLTRWNSSRCVEESFRMIESFGLTATFTKRLFEKLIDCLIELPSSFNFLSVNISPSYLCSWSFVSEVTPLLDACREQGITLWLELTEKTEYSSRNIDQLLMNANVNACKALGAKIALDDFGVAFHQDESIIQMILPDIVKLDRSLLNKQSITDLDYWEKIQSWKHQYKFDLVAEGIETSDELNFMQSLDVSYAQGYYLHRPSMVSDLCLKLSKPSSNHGSSAMWA
ncbi:EAL domain-containing protein [Vibrio owensii]|uniref:EAL domain-containing protein n=1 Tax=Vibrio owensii TaxID=696485 RepID=UPI003749406B